MFVRFWNKILALFDKKQVSDDMLMQANDDFTHQLAKTVRRNGTLTGVMGFAIAVYILGNELDKIRLQNKIQELEERSCQCSMHHEEEK